MMVNYRTPGVYFEWLDRPNSLTRVRTDVAGFVGIARRGPLHKAVKVESWQQFVSTYGDVTWQGFLGYAVRGFFDNGGRECWIVRVADPTKAQPAAFTVYAGTNRLNPLFTLECTSPGVWGRDMTVQFVRAGRDSFNLTVLLKEGRGNIRQTWRNLPLNNYAELVNRISDGDNPRRRVGEPPPSYIEDSWRATRLIKVVPAYVQPNTDISQNFGECFLPENWTVVRGRFLGGKDGLLTLNADMLTGQNQPSKDPFGLAILAYIDAVSIVAIPDIMPTDQIAPPIKRPRPIDCTTPDSENGEPPPEKPTFDDEREFPPVFERGEVEALQQALITHCELLKDRFAVLDTPRIETRNVASLDVDALIQRRTAFDSKYAAMYFPWLLVPQPAAKAGGNGLIKIPPCGHVAGIYAQGDLSVGVHKPPANVDMQDVKDIAIVVDDLLHGYLNDQQINVIRAYPGRGIRIMGARTLSSDTLWQFINVRRLITMIEETIDESIQWTVFEPNSADLWRKVERIARNFLDGLWRAGMLDGVREEDAFTVTCDETTNPEEQVNEGWLMCEIGVKPPYPAEFVIVRIGKSDGGTEIREN